MGLFKGKEGYYLAPTTLVATKIFDPLVDEDETENTGWQVTALVADSSLRLMEAKFPIRAGKGQAVHLTKEVIDPGDSLHLGMTEKAMFCLQPERKESICLR